MRQSKPFAPTASRSVDNYFPRVSHSLKTISDIISIESYCQRKSPAGAGRQRYLRRTSLIPPNHKLGRNYIEQGSPARVGLAVVKLTNACSSEKACCSAHWRPWFAKAQ